MDASEKSPGDRPLELALRVRRDPVGHQGVGEGEHDGSQEPGQQPGEHHPALGGRCVTRVADRGGGDPDESGPSLAQPGNQHPEQDRLAGHHDAPHQGERGADHRFRPAESQLSVEAPGGRVDLVGHHPEKERDEQSEDLGVLAHLLEGAQGIGPFPVETAAALGREGFRQYEDAVTEIEEAHDRRGEERRSGPQRAKQPAQGRADDEAQAEHRAHHPEILGPLFR